MNLELILRATAELSDDQRADLIESLILQQLAETHKAARVSAGRIEIVGRTILKMRPKSRKKLYGCVKMVFSTQGGIEEEEINKILVKLMCQRVVRIRKERVTYFDTIEKEQEISAADAVDSSGKPVPVVTKNRWELKK